MNVHIDAALVPVVAIGALTFDGLEMREGDSRLDGPLAEAEQRVRTAPPAVRRDVRAMYRAIGLDPTKTRPSSEALLRRVGRGEPLPRINTLVDVCNWCSLELQLPYGVYDLGTIEPPVELRLGRPAEAYPGIRKDEVHLEGRPVLADRTGAFGNPTSDSSRTMTSASTTRALVVLFVPRTLPPAEMMAALQITAVRVRAHCGGNESSRHPKIQL